MVSRRVKSGLMGVSANASGNGVLLQATEEGDGCQQARTVLTPDEADEIAARLVASAAEVRKTNREGTMRKPEQRGTTQQKLAVEALRLRKRARERREDTDAARQEEMAEFEAKLRRESAESADPGSSGSSGGGRSGYDEM